MLFEEIAGQEFLTSPLMGVDAVDADKEGIQREPMGGKKRGETLNMRNGLANAIGDWDPLDEGGRVWKLQGVINRLAFAGSCLLRKKGNLQEKKTGERRPINKLLTELIPI